MDDISYFIKLMEKNSHSGSGGTDWKFWSEFGDRLGLKYKYSDAIDDDLIRVLIEYENIWSTSTQGFSPQFSNFANDIVDFFETYKGHKLKSSAHRYISKIVEHLLSILKSNHHLISSSYFMIPSLKILSDYVDERGDALIEELFNAKKYPEDLLAINLVNCQFGGPLTLKYNRQAKQLLSSGKNPLIIKAMEYYRFDKGTPDNEIVTTIVSFLFSNNTDLQWNALAFFETHIDYAKTYIQQGILEKFLESDDEEISDKARRIFSNLS